MLSTGNQFWHFFNSKDSGGNATRKPKGIMRYTLDTINKVATILGLKALGKHLGLINKGKSEIQSTASSDSNVQYCEKFVWTSTWNAGMAPAMIGVFLTYFFLGCSPFLIINFSNLFYETIKGDSRSRYITANLVFIIAILHKILYIQIITPIAKALSITMQRVFTTSYTSLCLAKQELNHDNTLKIADSSINESVKMYDNAFLFFESVIQSFVTLGSSSYQLYLISAHSASFSLLPYSGLIYSSVTVVAAFCLIGTGLLIATGSAESLSATKTARNKIISTIQRSAFGETYRQADTAYNNALIQSLWSSAMQFIYQSMKDLSTPVIFFILIRTSVTSFPLGANGTVDFSFISFLCASLSAMIRDASAVMRNMNCMADSKSSYGSLHKGLKGSHGNSDTEADNVFKQIANAMLFTEKKDNSYAMNAVDSFLIAICFSAYTITCYNALFTSGLYSGTAISVLLGISNPFYSMFVAPVVLSLVVRIITQKHLLKESERSSYFDVKKSLTTKANYFNNLFSITTSVLITGLASATSLISCNPLTLTLAFCSLAPALSLIGNKFLVPKTNVNMKTSNSTDGSKYAATAETLDAKLLTKTQEIHEKLIAGHNIKLISGQSPTLNQI